MAEKITLSCHWTDEEGWAGDRGKLYLPGRTVSFEDPGHAALLRHAGYEATDVKPAAKKATAPRKAAAKKATAPAPSE